MKRTVALLLSSALGLPASAQMSPDSPVVQAIRGGLVSAALPASQGAQLVAQKIQLLTKNPGEITIVFVRVSRFASQPLCGRVGYALFQAATNTYWPQLGGQINVCDDGTPPLRSCRGTSVLVPAESQCSDGSSPVDTPEVSAAIAQAVKGGSQTAEQFKAHLDRRAKGEVSK